MTFSRASSTNRRVTDTSGGLVSRRISILNAQPSMDKGNIGGDLPALEIFRADHR
jgi:hypothetical protein